MKKTPKGINPLLMAKEIVSTISRSAVGTRPRSVVFFSGKNFMPSLLTTYRGATLTNRITKIHAIITDTRLDVTKRFTYNLKKQQHH